MKIIAISDTHGMHDRITVPPGDMLVFAGDMCNCGSIREVKDFGYWLSNLPHKHKVVVAGNHDWPFERDYERDEARKIIGNCATYLEDSSVEIEGVSIYGSPWQPEFCGWAFNLPRGDQLRRKWSMIPQRLDLLITHGPPAGIMDSVKTRPTSVPLGCQELRHAVVMVGPAYHVFGHIHDGYGEMEDQGIKFVNASACNESYHPENKPIEFEIGG